MKNATLRTLIAGCAIIGLSGAAHAGAPAPTAEDATPFQAADAVSGSDLGAITGRADTAMLIRAQNSSTVANNSVIGDSTTGGISFDSQAFQSLSGLSLLSANTGNNVSINSSLNLNVAINP